MKSYKKKLLIYGLEKGYFTEADYQELSKIKPKQDKSHLVQSVLVGENSFDLNDWKLKETK